MKTAKEMFEKLGYEWAIFENEKGKCKLRYEHKDDFEKDIEFYVKDEEIYTSCYILSKEVLKAMYQQCKELGWLDEE